MLLHTVNKSPYERNCLDSCLSHAVKGAGILLYEDAVYAAVKGSSVSGRIADALSSCAVYVLESDLRARGMDPANIVEGVKLVDYGGFVDLCTEYSAVQAWL